MANKKWLTDNILSIATLSILIVSSTVTIFINNNKDLKDDVKEGFRINKEYQTEKFTEIKNQIEDVKKDQKAESLISNKNTLAIGKLQTEIVHINKILDNKE